MGRPGRYCDGGGGALNWWEVLHSTSMGVAEIVINNSISGSTRNSTSAEGIGK